MHTAYVGRVEELGSELKDDGLEYALSMGRRAPMHKMHVDCLREIIEAGLMPIFGIGSANDETNSHYDPLKNPMTSEQQREQLRIVVEREFPLHAAGIVALAFTLEDVGHGAKWSQSVAKALNDKRILGKCVMHFRPKLTDTVTSKSIRPLQYYTDLFAENGIPVWESSSINPASGELEEMSATEMRDWDLNNLTEEQYDALAAPEYIITLANAARENNLDREWLDNAEIPVTMFDLSLERMYKEAEITTLDIAMQAESQGKVTLDTLRSVADDFLGNYKKHQTSHVRRWTDAVLSPRQPGQRPHTFGTLGYGTTP